MATTNPRTFEEYNFQEFLKTKQENDTLKNEIKEKEDYANQLEISNQELIQVIKTVAKLITLELSENDYYKLFVGGEYCTLIFESDKPKFDAIFKLVELAKNSPSREE